MQGCCMNRGEESWKRGEYRIGDVCLGDTDTRLEEPPGSLMVYLLEGNICFWDGIIISWDQDEGEAGHAQFLSPNLEMTHAHVMWQSCFFLSVPRLPTRSPTTYDPHLLVLSNIATCRGYHHYNIVLLDGSFLACRSNGQVNRVF